MRFTEAFMVVPVFVVILAVVRLFGIVVVGTWLESVPHLNLMTIIVLLGAVRLAADRARGAGGVPAAESRGFVEAALCIGATQRTSCSGTSCRTRCRR